MWHWRNIVSSLGGRGVANGQIVDADRDTQTRAYAALVDAGWVSADVHMSTDVTALLVRGLPIRMSFWSQPELGCGVDFEVGIDLVQNERSWARVASFMSRLAMATGKSVMLGPPGSAALADMTVVVSPTDGVVRLREPHAAEPVKTVNPPSGPDVEGTPWVLGHYASFGEIKRTFWPGVPHDPDDPEPPFSERDPRGIP